MNLFITRVVARRHGLDEVDDYPHYLSHENEPVEVYRKYDNYLPRNGWNSWRRNFFDDLDLKDYHWINVARKYLGKH